MSKSLPLASMLLLACLVLRGQSISTLAGAQAQGLGYASSCLSNEWSLLNNVAGLSGIDKPTAAATFAISTFLPDGNVQALTFSYPFKSIVSGISAFSFGDNLYREQVISMGFASTLGIAALGIKLNYIQYRAAGFGQRGMVTLNLGGITTLSPKISIGAHIININQPKISDQDEERIPTKLLLGIRLDLTEKILVTAELEKDIAFSPTFKMGIAYAPQKKITLRTGFNLHPHAAFFGIGFQYKRFLLDYAFEYRLQTGIGNQASLGLQLGKK